MYTKIEEYCWCDIYKNIDGGVYVAAYDGKKIATGSYLRVKSAVLNFWEQMIAGKSK